MVLQKEQAEHMVVSLSEVQPVLKKDMSLGHWFWFWLWKAKPVLLMSFHVLCKSFYNM
jgi:hypothetical protein